VVILNPSGRPALPAAGVEPHSALCLEKAFSGDDDDYSALHKKYNRRGNASRNSAA
jgi:hypothetical protein